MTHKTELPKTDHISATPSRRASSKLPSVGLVIGALLLGTAASAQTIAARTGIESEKVDSQAAPPPSGLTGDWGGMRTSLHDTSNVQYVAPGHCTGEPAFTALKRAFGDLYLFAGLATTSALSTSAT